MVYYFYFRTFNIMQTVKGNICQNNGWQKPPFTYHIHELLFVYTVKIKSVGKFVSRVIKPISFQHFPDKLNWHGCIKEIFFPLNFLMKYCCNNFVTNLEFIVLRSTAYSTTWHTNRKSMSLPMSNKDVCYQLF